MTTTVAVAIFAHDHEDFVARCIESFLEQSVTGPAIEIVVVDDASNDGTWEVIQRYASDPRIRATLRHERNTGAPRTYRDGIALTTGRYVVPVDADDYALTPRALESCLELAERSPRVGFVFSGYDIVDSLGRRMTTETFQRQSAILPGTVAFRRLVLGNVVHHSGTMIRRSAYDDAGGYDADLISAVDWDLWLRIATTYDVGYVAAPLYAYRIHGRNLHLRWLEIIDEQMNENLGVIDRALDSLPSATPSLRSQARSANYLLGAKVQFANFHRRRGLRYLASAVMAAPVPVLVQVELYRALIRLLIAVVVPKPVFRRVRAIRDRARVRGAVSRKHRSGR